MRELSPVERLWLTAEALHPPFAICWVVQGPPPEGMESALSEAALANPGTRARLQGWLGRCRWESSDAGIPVVRSTLPFRPGLLSIQPVAGLDVVLHPNASVFRCRHALVDGRGLQHFVEDVYRSLRGETLLGSSEVGTDLELADQSTAEVRPYPREVHAAVTGDHSGDRMSLWGRTTAHHPASPVTGRALVALTEAAAAYHPEVPVCFHVPVDLRREGERTLANRTGMVFLEGGADPGVLQQALREALPEAAAWIRAQRALRWVPLSVMRWFGGRAAARSIRNSRFGASAVVSNLGRVRPGAFDAPGRVAEAVYWIGPGGPATAAFVSLLGAADRTEIVAVVPQGLADEGRLQDLLDRLRLALEGVTPG